MTAVDRDALAEAFDAMGIEPEDTGARELANRLLASGVLDRIRHEGGVQALRDAADDWQRRGWLDSPTRKDRVVERIAKAQHVCDWLRERAYLAGQT